MNIKNRPITTKSINGTRSRFLFKKLNKCSFKWRLKTPVNLLTDRLCRKKSRIVIHSNSSSNSMIASNSQTICKIPKIFNFKFSWTLAVVLYQTAKLSAVFLLCYVLKMISNVENISSRKMWKLSSMDWTEPNPNPEMVINNLVFVGICYWTCFPRNSVCLSRRLWSPYHYLLSFFRLVLFYLIGRS